MLIPEKLNLVKILGSAKKNFKNSAPGARARPRTPKWERQPKMARKSYLEGRYELAYEVKKCSSGPSTY